jgi:ABC-type oligopeptide transport system ATPase subunit
MPSVLVIARSARAARQDNAGAYHGFGRAERPWSPAADRLGRFERRTFRRDVQAIFQDPYGVYNPFYRVDHVLTVPVRRFGLAASRSAARDLIADALRAVGLRPEEILGRYPHQLSGGQRQRVMVARALCQSRN